MRFSKYINLSCKDEKVNQFRELDIKLVKEESKYKEIVENIEEKYKTGIDIIDLIDDLNRKLQKVYKGNLRFDFCIGEGKVLKEIKQLNNKRIDSIKSKYYDLRSYLSKMKTLIERDIKEKK